MVEATFWLYGKHLVSNELCTKSNQRCALSSTAITQVYAHISAQHQADEMRRAFGKGAQTKTEIIKILDTMDEKRLKQVLVWLKSI